MKKLAIILAAVLLILYLLKQRGYNPFAAPAAAPATDPNVNTNGGASSPPINSGSLGVPLPGGPFIINSNTDDYWSPISDDAVYTPPLGSLGVPQ